MVLIERSLLLLISLSFNLFPTLPYFEGLLGVWWYSFSGLWCMVDDNNNRLFIIIFIARVPDLVTSNRRESTRLRHSIQCTLNMLYNVQPTVSAGCFAVHYAELLKNGCHYGHHYHYAPDVAGNASPNGEP